MKFFSLATLVAALLTCGFAQAQSEVTVWTYNDRTPFVVDKAKHDGLEYRLCDWLTRESKGQYHYTLKVSTAPEIRSLLEADKLDGIVLGVNPVWFAKAIADKALWTPPILFDKNCVLSLSAAKVDYKGPASLAGKRIAVVKAWFYPELKAQFEGGQATRLDFGSEPLALKAVAEGKADVAIVSEWTFLYEQLRNDLQGDWFQADQPLSAFTRQILVPASRKALHEHLGKVLADVKKNAGWQEATSL